MNVRPGWKPKRRRRRKMSGETRCRVCGRLLTAPLSVRRGVGPVCWGRLKTNYTLEDYSEEAEALER